MPKFLDHHAMPMMSADQQKAMMDKVKLAVESKKPDKFGVKVLNVFLADGQAWGYEEAPNAEAVVKNHDALGIKITLKDVTEVNALV
jgi:hypothetical protein